MIASWIAEGGLADWFVKSAALILLTWGAVLFARQLRAPAALRHLLWLLAIVSVVALPVVSALMPVKLAVLPALAQAAPLTTGSLEEPAAWTSIDGLVALYIAVTAALLLRFIVGQLLVNAMWSRAERVNSIASEAAVIAHALGLQRPAAVRIIDIASAPMTWGAVFPKIVLPGDALQWPPEQRRLVLMHELVHVTRADSATQMFVSLALAFAWFHPGLWIAANYLRREQEHACDERVLLSGAAANDYARALLEVAARAPVVAGAVALQMAARSQLEARLAEIIRQAPRRFGVGGLVVTTAVALSALAGVAALAYASPVAQAEAFSEFAASAATAEPEDRSSASDIAVVLHDPAEEQQRHVHRASLTSLSPIPAASAIPPVPPIPAVPAIPATPAVLPVIPPAEVHSLVCPRRAKPTPV